MIPEKRMQIQEPKKDKRPPMKQIEEFCKRKGITIKDHAHAAKR